jgi:2-polyprenyl-6-methoxyphenol hydroxylase-like FAD-dependent oxidoreductase
VKIHVLGGGPAGLYFSILMKQEDPAHEIVVHERNGPDDTFGWGVVFSDKTLSYLADADAPSHAAILAAFETWDNVDVVHAAGKVSIRGNRFSGIERLALLKILQRRCLELGVDVRFRSEVRDVAPHRAAADLVVGADGINSLVRRTFEGELRPSLETRQNAYIWFGTPHLFHGLTLTFREDEAGLFIAHSYKYSKARSTFIVECDRETWLRAGMDGRPDEDARRYLERVFREDLAGAPLLSNQSRWIRFIVVRNERWHHENVVLLGDALHTVHFSIGSGTKLALEDAIALAGALRDLGGRAADVPAALARFEAGRRPVVDEYQAAARESMTWFEEARTRMRLAPLAFALDVMTRSSRVDLASLRRRDPEFVAACERAGVV